MKFYENFFKKQRVVQGRRVCNTRDTGNIKQ